MHSSARSISPGDSARWPIQCLELLSDFQDFLVPHVNKKKELRELGRYQSDTGDEIQALMKEVATHYQAVLNLFAKAIQSLETAERETASRKGKGGLLTSLLVTKNNLTAPPVSLFSSPPPTPGEYPESPMPDSEIMAQRILARNARRSLKRPSDEDPDEICDAKRGAATVLIPRNEVSGVVDTPSPGSPSTPIRRNHIRRLRHGS